MILRTRSARTAAGAATAFLFAISCGQDRPDGSLPDADPQPERTEQPVVGGACSYKPLSFTVIIDSVLTSGEVILHAVDSIPWVAGFCPLREEGNGRWRASQSIVRNVAQGDTAVVEGDVIESGTCAPCNVVIRPVGER